MLTSVEAIVNQLVTDVADVWDVPADSHVFVDPPRIPDTRAPFAVIALDGVRRDAEGARHTDETLTFQITGVFPILDPTKSLLSEKLRLAQALGARLTPEVVESGGAMPTSGRYASVGWGAFIPSVSFIEQFEASEPVFTLTVTFEVRTTVYE